MEDDTYTFTLTQDKEDDPARRFRSSLRETHNFFAMSVFLVMISVTAFIFTKYRHSKFDKPYLFVVLAFTCNYFVESVLSLIYLSGVEDKYDIDSFKAITRMI